ncbi:fumarate hydratase, partial [Candidatus Poribacteria bacterium]
MRVIHVSRITDAVERICIEANCELSEDVMEALRKGLEMEESEIGREVLKRILENAEVARRERLPICQDCGTAVLWVEVGEDLRVEGGSIEEAINEGVRRGYSKGYLRRSIVSDPLFDRVNTGDNTPAIIHYRVVPGDRLRIVFMPKGGGSENMSALRMLTPAEGVEGLKKFVLETVERAGPNPCPPLIVGVGVGGNFETAAILAKRALMRRVGEPHPSPRVAQLENELLEEINSLGIGPQGLGGRITALAVHIEVYPCHIASLPAAVNLQCHAARH